MPGLDVTEEEVERQVDRLRENDAELEVVDRPAIDGDLVTIDLHGNDASGAEVVGVDDYLYEVGSGSVVPELDAELHGAKAGAILAFDAANPNEPEATVAFRVLVKEVKVKKLPEATDEWAAESSEFATVAELRADIEDRIGRVKLMQSQMALRQKTLEALAGAGRRRRSSPRCWSTPRSTSACTTCSTGSRRRSWAWPSTSRPRAPRPTSCWRRCGWTRRRPSRPTWRCGPWWRRRS